MNHNISRPTDTSRKKHQDKSEEYKTKQMNKHWSEVLIYEQQFHNELLKDSEHEATASQYSSDSLPPRAVPSPIYPTLPLPKEKGTHIPSQMTRHQIINLFSTYSDSDKGR